MYRRTGRLTNVMSGRARSLGAHAGATQEATGMTLSEQIRSVAFHPMTMFVVLAIVYWWTWARRRSRGTGVAPQDPLLVEASKKARAALGEMRKLFAEPDLEVMVKYPLETSAKEVEHVWGILTAITETEMTVTLATPPMGGTPMSPPPYTLPLSILEDWHVTLPDQRIRGGFTTQAQIKVTRRSGKQVPAQIEEMESRFIDS
jgi:hypothetical protein